MVRELFVEEIVRDAFIYENSHPAVGILIGAYSESGNLSVVHLAQTFDDNDRGEVDQGRDEEVELIGKSFMAIEPSLIALHAKQVIRMLPGGIFVLGIFVVEEFDIFTSKYESTLKNLLQAINKGLGKNPYYQSSLEGSNPSDKIIIHFNPTTKKFNVKLVDNLEVYKPKTLQTTFKRMEWVKLESEFDTFSAMQIPRDSLPLKKNTQMMMKSFQESLNTATYLIGGQIPSPDTRFEEPADYKGKAVDLENGLSDFEDEDKCDMDEELKSESPVHSRPISPCHILMEKVPGVNLGASYAGINGEELDFINHLHMQGKIAALAFVEGGSSTSYVAQMLKQDILRSLAARLEMHCDSLIDEEQDGEFTEPRVYHEIPRRVFAQIPGLKLSVSDYLFPGEGAKDSLRAFQDILGIKLQDETDILMNKEKQFDMEEMESHGSMEELLSKAESITKIQASHSKSAIIWFVVASLFIGGVSLLIPYYFNLKF